ncbi:MAG: methylthioribulose 1-phosphate dehydratase [Bacteroidota bacterium]|nr:methylthioribulose 1-phosphate dehydratase [Bacteroidota bacterium]
MRHDEENEVESLKSELVSAIHFLYLQGWAPATSSNYSFRDPMKNQYWISRSGVNKEAFFAEQLMAIDAKGEPVYEKSQRSSAETLLHTMLYENPGTNAVLHTHSVNNTVLSLLHEQEGSVSFTGFELQKGIQNVTDHNAILKVPVFRNSQDIAFLSDEVRNYYHKNPGMTAFLLAGHGLYTWGPNIAVARRHVEVFEFLFECKLKLKQYGNP